MLTVEDKHSILSCIFTKNNFWRRNLHFFEHFLVLDKEKNYSRFINVLCETHFNNRKKYQIKEKDERNLLRNGNEKKKKKKKRENKRNNDEMEKESLCS